jgi:RNA polymerase sigma factor (sigma-70 family)
MNGNEWLAERFEANRPHLRAVAHRMLGSLGEADDAVQECWLRVSRSDTSGVENLEGWLTTILARVCLNTLRARKSRREDSMDTHATDPVVPAEEGIDPEQEALLAESVGLALLVVLEKLAPAERVAFVLHDVFAVPFEDISPILGRSPTAARQLASRARRRVRGAGMGSAAALAEQRATVEAFLAALRAGDVDGLLAVLDPDVVRRADRVAVPSGAATELRGATAVVNEALTHTDLARSARPILVNGSVGIVVAPGGRLRLVISCTVKARRIVEMEVIAEPARLRKLNLALPGTDR